MLLPSNSDLGLNVGADIILSVGVEDSIDSTWLECFFSRLPLLLVASPMLRSESLLQCKLRKKLLRRKSRGRIIIRNTKSGMRTNFERGKDFGSTRQPPAPRPEANSCRETLAYITEAY